MKSYRKYEKMQARVDELYVIFQTKYKIEPDDLDEYTKLIEDMTIIKQGEE